MMKHRRHEKIRWMGIWYAMFGDFRGIRPNDAWDPVKAHVRTVRNRLLPRANLESAKAYYRHLFRAARECRFDLLKTDFQTHNIGFFGGGGWNQRPSGKADAFDNPYEASVIAQRGFHEVVREDFEAVINCNWHNAACLFNSFDSVVGR